MARNDSRRVGRRLLIEVSVATLAALQAVGACRVAGPDPAPTFTPVPAPSPKPTPTPKPSPTPAPGEVPVVRQMATVVWVYSCTVKEVCFWHAGVDDWVCHTPADGTLTAVVTYGDGAANEETPR